MTLACPACGAALDVAAQLDGAPLAGDWAVCECLAVLRFESELALRVATPEERDGPDAPDDLKACLKALKRNRKRDAGS